MIKILKNEKGYFSDFLVLIAAIAIINFFFLYLGLVSKSLVNETSSNPEKELIFKEEIHALKDNSEVQGTFFLGTGGVGEKFVYKYMVQNDAGGLIQKAVDASSSQIFYLDDESVQPYVEKYQKTERILLFPIVKYEYHFYLPRGSVTENFNVDME